MTRSSSQPANAASGIRLRIDVLEEACDRLRSLPYSALRYVAGIVVVRDGKTHRLQVRVQRNQSDSKDVQVTVKLPARGRWHPEFVRRFVKKSQGALSS
jgi:hypothetical protein